MFYCKNTGSASELELDQQLILFQTLKNYQKRNHICTEKRNKVSLDNFSDESVDEFIRLILSEKLTTLDDLNRELKDS